MGVFNENRKLSGLEPTTKKSRFIEARITGRRIFEYNHDRFPHFVFFMAFSVYRCGGDSHALYSLVMDAKIDPLEGLDLDDSHNIAILTVTSVFFGISLVSVMLRCFVRTQVVRAWGWDDGTMVIAMVSYPAPFT